MKTRVLHIIKSLGRGGAEMLLPETLKLHDKNLFEFHYIYFLPWKDNMVNEIKHAGGVVTCLSSSNNIQILLQARRIIRYAKKHDIQIIHCHLPWAGLVGRVVHRLIKIPVIYTEHNKQERYHGITFWLNKFSFNWQTKVIAVSDDVKKSIVKNIGPRIPVSTILNGVNTNAFRRDNDLGQAVRSKLGIPGDSIVIGTIAVFRFQKRLNEWLEVFAKICEQRSNVFGIIVGAGPLQGEVEKRRADLHLQTRVFMPGLQENVKPWLSSMDIYLMTSKFEGLPIALLEAMSMECAIASTDAGGIKEVIRHERDGLVSSVDNWIDLPQLIHSLLDDETRSLYAKRGRSRVVEMFSLSRMVRELEDEYTTLSKK